jgi:hypothetical protein
MVAKNVGDVALIGASFVATAFLLPSGMFHFKITTGSLRSPLLASGHAGMFRFFGKVTNPEQPDYWIGTLRPTRQPPPHDSEMAADAF